MAAMEMMNTHYDPMLFALLRSQLVSLVALKLSLQFRHQRANKVLQILSAIVMGAGVVTLHYADGGSEFQKQILKIY